jgi:hypothetical protein
MKVTYVGVGDEEVVRDVDDAFDVLDWIGLIMDGTLLSSVDIVYN